jgi:transposase|tara:strand:+ start:452 stop:880 length:429 start_codon:yes stop_codon:yes gene_type:complete
MGRSRGGLTTKIHALVDAGGLPVRLTLTPGQTHDGQAVPMLLDALSETTVVLADKAYDADWIRDLITAQGAAPNIPDRSNRKDRHCFSKVLYKERNLVERFFNKIKQFRRVATRYEKLGANFLAMTKLAAIRIWLRSIESTA